MYWRCEYQFYQYLFLVKVQPLVYIYYIIYVKYIQMNVIQKNYSTTILIFDLLFKGAVY